MRSYSGRQPLLHVTFVMVSTPIQVETWLAVFFSPNVVGKYWHLSNCSTTKNTYKDLTGHYCLWQIPNVRWSRSNSSKRNGSSIGRIPHLNRPNWFSNLGEYGMLLFLLPSICLYRTKLFFYDSLQSFWLPTTISHHGMEHPPPQPNPFHTTPL